MNRLILAQGCVLGLGFLSTANANHSCSRTSQLMRAACLSEVRDDYFVGLAICENESEWREHRECRTETREALWESRALCHEQRGARQVVCADIGQAPYDPRFEPEDFETSLSNLSQPNPYFPMVVGHEWSLSGDGEDVEITVLDETKHIDDVTCFVVRDVVTVDGDLVEDTDDWFAHGRDGGIWYCGEEVKEFEFFDGDNPRLPELIAIDGSFKVERDGDRAGVIFPANPEVGVVFRQEFSLGNAEDIGEIVSVNYSFGQDPELDNLVPQELVEALCDDDCVVVAEYTPMEPEVFELKYYASGIGFFLGTNPVDEEAVQLVGCNFDPRCDSLPTP